MKKYFRIFVTIKSLAMKKFFFISSVLVALILWACSMEPATPEVSKTNIKVKTNEVVANRMMTAEVEGMGCSQKKQDSSPCENKLTKKLIETNAIESCEVDYRNDRKVNVVKVAFDKDKISADKLVYLISNMHEPSLKVNKVQTKIFESENITLEQSEPSIETTEESRLKVKESTIETPNILQLFSRLITG